ncbi:hypothetical protein I5535_17975 [Rhodobacteraceae bacterium F11138]|nr:hypothetical protein [Rhodobacteraceae bacterium F11138]
MTGWRHIVLTTLLCAAVLLPRASAVVAEFAPVHITRIVICTGSDVITILLDQNGNPVEDQAAVSHHCVAAHATPLMTRALPAWQVLARTGTVDGISPRAPLPMRPARTRPAAPRAPPMVRDNRT